MKGKYIFDAMDQIDPSMIALAEKADFRTHRRNRLISMAAAIPILIVSGAFFWCLLQLRQDFTNPVLPEQTLPHTGLTEQVDLQPETADPAVEYQFGILLDTRSSPCRKNDADMKFISQICAKINGTILEPGERFSFLEIIGTLAAEQEDSPEKADSLNHVASVLYASAMYMNLTIEQRWANKFAVSYLAPGLDAAVSMEKRQDLVFVNNRNDSLRIQADMANDAVNIFFWGTQENEISVEIESEVTEALTAPDEIIPDPSQPKDYCQCTQYAKPGMKVQTHQKIYSSDGELLQENVIESTYQAQPNIYIVGTADQHEPPKDGTTSPEP